MVPLLYRADIAAGVGCRIDALGEWHKKGGSGRTGQTDRQTAGRINQEQEHIEANRSANQNKHRQHKQYIWCHVDKSVSIFIEPTEQGHSRRRVRMAAVWQHQSAAGGTARQLAAKQQGRNDCKNTAEKQHQSSRSTAGTAQQQAASLADALAGRGRQSQQAIAVATGNSNRQ